MKKFLFLLILWTWGLPVSGIGWFLFVFFKRYGYVSSKFFYAKTIHFYSKRSSGMSIGPYIFIFHPQDQPLSKTHLRRYLTHEYGHTCQVLLLGPLYWLLVGIPSFLWANLPFFEKYRHRNNVSYYVLYCEKWANHWGQKATSNKKDRKNPAT